MRSESIADLNRDYDARYGFADPEEYFHKAPKGLGHETVEMISRHKEEPDWMRRLRHEALDTFLAKPMPKWGNQDLLGAIDFADIHYYIRPTDAAQARDWKDVPEGIKRTFDRLGLPDAERKFLALILVKLPLQQGFDFMDRLRCIGAFRMHANFAARAGSEHHQAHDALSVHRLTVFLHEHFTLEAIGRFHEHGGGTGVDAKLVGHDHFLFEFCSGVARLFRRAHLFCQN